LLLSWFPCNDKMSELLPNLSITDRLLPAPC
jgi:hypothetical protein